MRLVIGLFFLTASCLPTKKQQQGSVQSAPGRGEATVDSWANGDTVVTPNKATYVFRYLEDPAAATDPQGNVRKELSYAATQNATATHLTRSIAAGNGLYGAADPFSSQEYGAYLMILPLKPNSAVRVHTDKSTVLGEVKDATIGAIAYNYRSFLPTGSKTLNFATVVRSEAELDMPNVTVLGPHADACDGTELVELPAVTDLIPAIKAGLDAHFEVCAVKPIAIYFNGNHATKEIMDGITDEDLLSLVARVFPKVLITAFGGDPSLMKRSFVTTLSSSLSGREHVTGGSVAEWLKDASDLKLVDPATPATSKEDVSKAVLAKVKAEHPEILSKMRSQMQYFGDLYELVYAAGMTTWTKQ